MFGKKVLTLFLIWSVPGLIGAVQIQSLFKPPQALLDNLAWQVPPWWCWIPATLAIEALFEQRSCLQRTSSLAAVIVAAALGQAGVLYLTCKAFSHPLPIPPGALDSMRVLVLKYAP